MFYGFIKNVLNGNSLVHIKFFVFTDYLLQNLNLARFVFCLLF